MLLSVELEEGAGVAPGQVQPGDEGAVGVEDLELPGGLGNAIDLTRQLHHERLQQALCWWRAQRSEGEDPADPRCPWRSCPAECRQHVAHFVDRSEPLAQGGLQGLLPAEVIEHSGQVDQRLEAAGAWNAVHLNQAV
ncbi:MAG TPA: hypothetical protein VHH09_05695 [Acidimicrobiales bacterium]|nr:hypothetical protein [Acidimicrobiales bacterium]